MPNLSFHGQRELSTGLQFQQKVQNHTAIIKLLPDASPGGGKRRSHSTNFGLQIFKCWAKSVV